MRHIPGNQLTAEDQKYVLAAYTYRFTGDHTPTWAVKYKNEPTYPVQFKDDADWLANTTFAVRKNGRLDRRSHHCISRPTWPNGDKVI